MTNPTQRWTDNRLDQLATAVESNTRNVDILVGIVTGQQERGLTMLEEIRDIKVEIRDIKVEIRELQTEIRDLQNEIRGLQTENRRILDHLFGQEE